jgi:hypothetical protein
MSAEKQELLDRLAPTLSRSTEGLTWVNAGGGVRSLDLRGRFRHAMIAVRGQDGVVRSTCADSLSAVEAALATAKAGSP